MKRLLLLCAFIFALSGCTEIEFGSHVAKQAMPPSKSQGTFKVGSSYKVGHRRYTPRESYDLVETGIASWYGPQFNGKKTANGETFDMYELTAAHRTLQMPSLVRVTNLENGRSLIVRVNDRGPYKKGRIIDLSMRAAELLGYKSKGTAKVRLEVLPKESMQIAQAAKNGVDTSGYEVALNRGGQLPLPEPTAPTATSSYEVASATPKYGAGVPPAQPVTRQTITTPPETPGGMEQTIPGHTRNGNFYPDPIVTEMPVTPTSIYIQAGSFTVQGNASRLSAKLQYIAPSHVFPAVVNGRQFYRVRLGPIDTVEQADELLARVSAAGNENAIIVVQ